MKHLILGNGAAGITAAEKLRELDATAEITIISNEDTPVYTKCMLPDYVGGRLPREKLFIRSFETYRQNRIDLVTNAAVERTDPINKKVFLGDGRIIDYDRLLAAVGGSPFIPPVEGLAEAGYFTINSVTDADRIRQEASKGGKAVIMGAGLAGIEMGFALKYLGMGVCLVEKNDRILPLQLDTGSSAMMAGELRREGLALLLGRTVVRVHAAKGGRKLVELLDGEMLECDMLLVTVGTRPNLAVVKDMGLNCGRGIMVDEYMKSSLDDVYAAGDVAEAINKLSNEYVSSYIWPNAMAQGRCAAFNMSGARQPFSNASSMMNSVQLRVMPFISMGMVNPRGEGYEVLAEHNRDDRIYKRLVLKDDIVLGMTFFGDNRNANVVSGLIRKAVNVSAFKDKLLKEELYRLGSLF